MRRRTIKKYGNTHAIKLETSDLIDMDLKEGSEVDIEDITIIKRRKQK